MLISTPLLIYFLTSVSLSITSITGYPTAEVHQNQKQSSKSRMLSHLFKHTSNENDPSKFMTEYEPILHNHNLPLLPQVDSRVMDHKINSMYPDSRIFYFRMPVATSPYMFLNNLENFMNSIRAPSFVPYDMVRSIPIHLPITFNSNGKPSTIYKFPQNDFLTRKPVPLSTPKPTDTSVITLNKGPYKFNGKQADIYLLQDSFNNMMSNSLTDFYP